VARTPLKRPGDPWTDADFERHYRGAVKKATGGQAPDPDEDLAARLAWEHRKAVEQQKNYLRVRQEAEAELLSEASKPAPDPVRLDALLAEPDEPAAYRIDRLWPAGGRVILSAQRKAGKTTSMANLLRSLADGAPFLGCYQVTPLPDDATVFAIDTEMSRRMLRQWYGDQRISHPERIHVEPLRGAVASFNLLDAGRRAWWARVIRERQAAVLVLDCIGPVLAAAGLDENSSLDVGRFLAALEELLAGAGVGEAVACHHMGHVAERSRGASRLRDWPDAEWKLVYEIADGEQDAGPSDRRYFSAAGRDVAEPEQLLDYDAASRRLSIAGGTRRDEKKATYLAAIVAYVTSHPEAECSKTRLEQAVEGRAADIRKVLAEAVAETGPLCVHDGSRNARLHRIRASCAEHSATPSHPVQGVLGTEFSTPSTPIGDGVLNGAPGQAQDQDQRDGVKP
jgi:AAA domain